MNLEEFRAAITHDKVGAKIYLDKQTKNSEGKGKSGKGKRLSPGTK